MKSRAAPLLLLLCSSLPSQQSERRLPAFDTDTARATYVVSVPASYDADREYPLIIDLHGAINPSQRGASVTRARLWSRFVERVPCIVAGPNGRTRAWGRTRGERDDKAFALAVLAEVRKTHSIDPKRIYLAGFSSGSDFLCKAGLQLAGPFAGCLVVCPGPSSVVGLRGGELLRAKDTPFYFVTGEEDYVRKDGAWQAFLALDAAGARVVYREVPEVGHTFPDVEEYARVFAHLESMVREFGKTERLAIARAALQRNDFLLASSQLRGLGSSEAKDLMKTIEAKGIAAIAAAKAIDVEKEPGRAYEAWWHVRTQFHRFPKLADQGAAGMQALEKKMPRRDLYRARRDWFRGKSVTPARRGRGRNRPAAIGKGGLFGFDRYLSYDEMTEALKKLAADHPRRARLRSMGRSIEGRELWVLTVTDFDSGPPETKPAAYLQGGIHGNEISSVMAVLYSAWQLTADPEGSRGTRRILRDKTVYFAPAVNPDAVHHYLAEPHSSWRPRFNYRPYDSDRDGKTDEDGPEDLDGDGEIGVMYQRDPDGPFVVRDGRMVRGKGAETYKMLGREGRDDDGDGKFSEDAPGGVDLNRNFPVGHRPGRNFGGSRGLTAASEPETKAVIEFVTGHPNVSLFFDYHNDADCVFYWLGSGRNDDQPLFEAAAQRARKALGYAPKPLTHVGAGLAIAWAHGDRGLYSFLVELESTRGDKQAYWKSAWNGVFVPVKPFDHPDLGPILLGNHHRKLPRRNLHPKDLFWQVDRNWSWLKEELGRLPKLALIRPGNPKIEWSREKIVVTGQVRNTGWYPTDSARARANGKAFPIRVSAVGAKVRGTTRLPSLGGGATAPFRVELLEPAEKVTLVVTHPRAGRAELPLTDVAVPTVPVRRDYAVLEGYATPRTAKPADNEFFEKGRPKKERGPAFELQLRSPSVRVAVLLAEWKDERHTVSREEYERQLFGPYLGRSATGQHVYGSVRDFYREMSYGRFDVTGKVFDWLELPGSWKAARDASFGSQRLVKEMIDAVEAREGAGVLADYDCVAFVWAGNSVARGSMLWPMRVTLSRVRKDLAEVVAFKMGEYHHGEHAPIGVACHELAHTFGVNDKYGLGAGTRPMGPWCLIALGTNGGSPSRRRRPFHLCAWCKTIIGWVDPVAIDPTQPQRLALRPILAGPRECYRVLLRPDGSEYLLLENRRREGFFTDLQSPGLAIYKVGPNDKPASPQVRVQLIPAHGIKSPARGILPRPEAVAWPQPGKTELVFDGVRISGIRLVDDVVYFEVGPAN